jgi:hypothetical protein
VVGCCPDVDGAWGWANHFGGKLANARAATTTTAKAIGKYGFLLFMQHSPQFPKLIFRMMPLRLVGVNSKAGNVLRPVRSRISIGSRASALARSSPRIFPENGT